jgi:predicted AlkP superfamily pyrophosphatase or phosphodiesterase
LFLGSLVCAAREASAGAPPLTVLVIVDQLPRDRVLPSLPGGLGRFAREGRVFINAELGHAVAETCPGHAALATGRHPARSGLASNHAIERISGTLRYCVEDDPDSAGVLESRSPVGRSPRRLAYETLGDWLQSAYAGALVLAVSGKDRAAIALGGHHPTGAYWLRRGGEIAFTTSRYYAREVPAWVRAWNRAHRGFAGVPMRWDHAGGGPSERTDDYIHESPALLGRTSGHALRGGDTEVSSARVYRSPFVDELTLDFAAAGVTALGMGNDAVPDLLVVSLSGMDVVGHSFGPESHEAWDALRRLDGWLGSWLAALEDRLGPGRMVVALSSDHGVLPLPEWLAETGRATCPTASGRVSLDGLRSELRWHLHRKFGRWIEWPQPWLWHSSLQMTVNRTLAAERGVSADAVIREAKTWLEALPHVAAAWTPPELAVSADPMAIRYRRSVDPVRGADLVVQPEAGCLISRYEQGTSHGTPYPYDREVPIVLMGPGIVAGADPRPAMTVDLAPTLAELLGLTLPPDLDGASLLR